MKPVSEPRDDMYSVPRDLPADMLHYILVQVSPKRYIVAQFFSGNGIPEFESVSKPMSFRNACILAQTLKGKRAVAKSK
jgi:hypothetical protein